MFIYYVYKYTGTYFNFTIAIGPIDSYNTT